MTNDLVLKHMTMNERPARQQSVRLALCLILAGCFTLLFKPSGC